MDMYNALNDTLERLLDDDVKNFQCKIETTLNDKTVKYIIRKNENGEIEFEDCRDTKENDESKPAVKTRDPRINKVTEFYNAIEGIDETVFAKAATLLKKERESVYKYLDYYQTNPNAPVDYVEFDKNTNIFNEYVRKATWSVVEDIENKIDSLYDQINELKTTYIA